jgi:putative ABC transport system permease protein
MTGMRRIARWLAAATGTGVAAAIALGLLAGVVVFAAVAGPRESLGARTRALQQMFTATPAAGRSVQAAADWQQAASHAVLYGDVGPIRALGGGEISQVRQQLAGALAAVPLPLSPPSSDWASLSTAFNPVSGEARSAQASAGVPPQMELILRDSLARHSRLVSGREPGQVRLAGRARAAAFGVTVTTATAARFGLRPGSRLTLGLPGRPVTLVVTGIIRPARPAEAFWTLDPDAAAPSLNRPLRDAPPYWLGAAFVGPGELAGLQTVFGLQDMSLVWDYPLALGGVNADQAPDLAARLNRAAAQAGAGSPGTLLNAVGPAITSGLVGGLTAFAATQAAVQAVLWLLFTSLTVIGVVVVWLAAVLLVERRRGEFAQLRARGASLRQLAALMLRGSVLVVLPAAAAGAWLAVALTPGGGSRLAWWLGGAALLVAIAGPAWIAARRNRTVNLAPGRAADLAAGRRMAARRWVAEAALVAACVGGLIVLRQQGLSAAGGLNVYTSAAPVLLAVPAALLVLRLCPLLLRGLLRLASPQAGAAGFVGLATAARTALSATLPAFALVLALAMAAFGGMVSAAVSRGEVAASWRSAGADAIVNASGVPAGLTAAAERAIGAVPGARHSAAALVTATTVSGVAITVAAVDPAGYAALVAATPWPAVPRVLPERAPAGWSPGAGPTAGRGVVPVIASPAAAASLGRGTARLQLGYAPVTVRVAAVLRGTPALPGTGSFVLLPMWATRNRISTPSPTLMLVTGANLDHRALTAAVSRTVPGALVSFRSAELAGLARAPLPHMAAEFFAEGVALAAGLAAVILLLGLAAGARARDHALARLRILGLGRGQGRLLLATEALPPVLAAMAGGLACAWLLGPLVGPALNLSVFTGSAAGVAVRPGFAALAWPAAVLLGLAVAVLAVQAGLAARRSPAAELRAGE